MRRTMVGVAPAANAPSANNSRDASSGSENADTAVALPPDMAKALGELTVQSGPSSGPSSAPMTKRMSEAPLKALAVAPTPPRSAPSVAPPRSAPSVAPPRSSPSIAPKGTPSTNPMAAPLERKPLVTTEALSPPIAMIGGGASRASTSPPAYPSAPPPAGTIKGMPHATDGPTMMSAGTDGATMVLSPGSAPVAPTVSMPPPMPVVTGPHQAHPSHPPHHVMTGPHQAHPYQSHPPHPVMTGPHQAHPSQPVMTGPHQARSMPMPSTPKAFAPPNPPTHASPPPFAAAANPNPSWSTPGLAKSPPPSKDEPSTPLTYQVFDPSAVPPARPGAMSRVAQEEVGTKASLGLRVCLVLLGVCVVLGTAGAIIISSTDDAPQAKASPSASVAVGALTAPIPPLLPPAPPPVVLVADPPPVIAPPTTTTTTTVGKPAGSSKVKPAGSAPAALKGAKVPPNPFGGGGLPPKRK